LINRTATNLNFLFQIFVDPQTSLWHAVRHKIHIGCLKEKLTRLFLQRFLRLPVQASKRLDRAEQKRKSIFFAYGLAIEMS